MSSESSTGVFSGESYVPQNDYSSPPPTIPRPNATGSINIKNYLQNLEARLFSVSSRDPHFRWAFRSLVVLSADQFKSGSMRPALIVAALRNTYASYDLSKLNIVNLLRANGIPPEALTEQFASKIKPDLYSMLDAEQTRLANEESLNNAKFW